MSDTVSNSIRVVKTSKQAATEAVTYPAVIRDVIAKDGVLGLFGRGLKTKILSNGLQACSCCCALYPNNIPYSCECTRYAMYHRYREAARGVILLWSVCVS